MRKLDPWIDPPALNKANRKHYDEELTKLSTYALEACYFYGLKKRPLDRFKKQKPKPKYICNHPYNRYKPCACRKARQREAVNRYQQRLKHAKIKE